MASARYGRSFIRERCGVAGTGAAAAQNRQVALERVRIVLGEGCGRLRGNRVRAIPVAPGGEYSPRK